MCFLIKENGYIDSSVYHYEREEICCNINTDFSKVEEIDFHYKVDANFDKRVRVYTRFWVYHYEREGMYVNTPGVRARVEYPRHVDGNDVVVPHFFHLRTCD